MYQSLDSAMILVMVLIPTCLIIISSERSSNSLILVIICSPNTTWTHEFASTMLLEYLVDKNHLDLTREDVRLICDLIEGKNDGYKGSESKIVLIE